MTGEDFDKAEIERLAKAIYRMRSEVAEKLDIANKAIVEVNTAFSRLIGVWDNYSDKKDSLAKKIKGDG